MNQQQERNLRKLARELLVHTPTDLDMGTCNCALPVARALFGRSAGELYDSLNIADLDYLFSIGEVNWYSNPKGRAAAEEFADRAENVIQYYRTERGQ